MAQHVDKSSYAGIDIGGTSTRIGLFPTLDAPDCTIIARFPTCSDYGEQQQQIHQSLANQGVYRGIGISIGGRIAKDGRSVVVAPNMPFGGFGMSGIGRENGSSAVEEYLETKSVYVELTGGTRDPFKLG